MHVAILGHTAALSGGELALLRLLPDLQSRDVRVTVVLAEDGPLVSRLRETGAAVVVLPLAAAVRHRSRSDAGSLRRSAGAVAPTVRYVGALRRLLRQRGVDIVHTNTLKAAVYGGLAGRAAGLPVLWHIRDRIPDDYLPRVTAASVQAMARVLPHKIAVNSKATAGTLGAAVQQRVRVVPDCVVAADRGPAPRGDLVRRDVLTIGMMGRLAPWKGQDVTLQAFHRAFAAEDSVRLVFVGSAMFGEEDFEQSLRSRAHELGLADRVEFRGFQPDVWREYASFDVAVHASVLPEPFGQVVIEAMAAGVPVIAADAGGPAEVVTSGRDGLLVAPGSVPALADAMVSLVQQPGLRHRLAVNGRQRAAQYSPQQTVAALLDIYSSLR